MGVAKELTATDSIFPLTNKLQCACCFTQTELTVLLSSLAEFAPWRQGKQGKQGTLPKH